jgi:hypothetical protein
MESGGDSNVTKPFLLRLGLFFLAILMVIGSVLLIIVAPTSPDLATGRTWPIFVPPISRHSSGPVTVHFATGLGSIVFWGLPIAAIAIIVWLASLNRQDPQS